MTTAKAATIAWVYAFRPRKAGAAAVVAPRWGLVLGVWPVLLLAVGFSIYWTLHDVRYCAALFDLLEPEEARRFTATPFDAASNYGLSALLLIINALWTLTLAALLFAGMTFAIAPSALQSGRDFASTSIRTAISGAGFTAVFIIAKTLLWLVAAGLDPRYLGSDIFSSPRELFVELVLLATLCVWCSQAAEGVRTSIRSGVLTPRCEQCGYDLTHRPDKRCPECGEWCAASLEAIAARPGSAWNGSARDLKGWITASFCAVVMPKTFYSQLPVRSGMAVARRFALMHLVAMGLFAAIAFAFFNFLKGFDNEDIWFQAAAVGLLISICIWFTMRVIGGLILLVWMKRGVPDILRGQIVLAYETAWMWVVISGILILFIPIGAVSYINRFAYNWAYSLPFYITPRFDPTPWLVIIGFVFMIWTLVRSWIAFRAVRWSNF